MASLHRALLQLFVWYDRWLLGIGFCLPLGVDLLGQVILARGNAVHQRQVHDLVLEMVVVMGEEASGDVAAAVRNAVESLRVSVWLLGAPSDEP